MNRQLALTFVLAFLLLFVTTSIFAAEGELVEKEVKSIPIKQIVPGKANLGYVDKDKLKLKVFVNWDGTGEAQDEKATSRLRCFPKSVVKVQNSPQDHVFGDRSTTYDVLVLQKNKKVRCITGIFDRDSFRFSFSFKT
ncbi:hypothetical protein Glove_341g9 [Diversispora epigaea]|uniref:Uncharacterized protein n=1 Tax=Diversispora epigaea TaxID=1348612 RepID=A0A397HGY4_9GLOM|nr:hypothetical protein Glove_341g9 [Diversispora epigaea]